MDNTDSRNMAELIQKINYSRTSLEMIIMEELVQKVSHALN